MTVHQITEFAALIASHNRLFIELPRDFDEGQLDVCWKAARNRLIDLLRRLDSWSGVGPVPVDSSGECATTWSKLAPLLDEVFATEMLTRVWGALLAARQARHETSDSGEVARSMLILQLKVRQRALRLLVDGIAEDGAAPELAVADRMRRKLERWTDLLLGELVLRDNLADFAFDARRARDFGIDYFQNQTHIAYQCTWKLLIAGIGASFVPNGGGVDHAASPPEELFRAILGCLPVDAFHDDGPSLALRAIRANRLPLTADRRPSAAMTGRLRRIALLPDDATSAPADGISFSKLRRARN